MLKLQGILKQFNKNTLDETTLFDGFNLNIRKGDFVSIVGSNGSGKTTVLNIVSGNLEIDGGSILLENEKIDGQKEYVRAKRIGRVFQDPSKGTAPNMTILENLALAENKNKPYGLGLGLNKSKIDEYKALVTSLNMGLEHKLNVLVGNLSGGQRQALALLMATMTPIDLLLLDEHTAALDPHTSASIMELTKKIVEKNNITTLMVTHNLKFAVEYGNRMLMFDKGQIVLDKMDEEKAKMEVADLLEIFNEISIECGN